MKDIKLLSKNKYLKVPLLFSGSGGSVPEWRQHLQPCEYLETDGDCYIQTNILPNRFLETTIKVENFQQKENWLLGSRISNTSNMYAVFVPNELGFLRCDYQSINIFLTRFSISTTLQQLIIHFNYFDNETKKVSILDYSNNILDSKNLNDTAFGGAKEIPLFGGYATPSNLQKALPGTRIYNVEFILHDTNEKYNLQSCYVIDEYTDNKGNLCSAGVPGMVDTLTGIFYTNDGPGQFEHGEDIEI